MRVRTICVNRRPFADGRDWAVPGSYSVVVGAVEKPAVAAPSLRRGHVDDRNRTRQLEALVCHQRAPAVGRHLRQCGDDGVAEVVQKSVPRCSPRVQSPPHLMLIDVLGRDFLPELLASLGELASRLDVTGRIAPDHEAERGRVLWREDRFGAGQGATERRCRSTVIATTLPQIDALRSVRRGKGSG
jgi:hypothetical protein